jgi:hypothetical protein
MGDSQPRRYVRTIRLNESSCPKHCRHIVLPEQNTPLANYWLTLMQQAGLPVDQFSHSTGNLPELLI